MFRNILVAFAAMCLAMTASAQVSVTPAKVVVEKTTYACRSNTDCRVRVGLANHYKSWTCVGFTKTPYKLGRCEFEKFSCDDGDPTTLDGFTADKDPAKACVHTPPTCKFDSECEDGDGCTVDYCSYSGLCVSYERWNCTPCDTDDQCETQVQTQCSYASEMSWTEGCMPDGYCDRVWTETRFCPNGCDDAAFMCLEDADVDCQDGNPCTLDTFNPTTQECENTSTNEGLACDDGLNCTYNEFCSSGMCVAGANYADTFCADNNPCTVDTCLEAPFKCSNTLKSCDDGNACTNDSCNGATGGCLNTAKTCNDGALCTIDSCVASTGACASTAKNCDDGNSCTTDSCDSVTGDCVNAGKTCNDNNACTTDSCDASGACVNTTKSCDDGKPCTTDSCDGATGACVNAANTATCNDGSACTSNDVCANKVCGGTAVVCNDNNACTTDSCNPASGCVFATISGCVPPVSCSLSSKTAGAGIRPLVSFSCQGRFTDIGQSSESTYTGTVGTDLYDQSASGFYCWLKNLNGIPVNWGAMTTQAQKLAACKQAMVGLNACGQEVPISVTTDAWGACVVSFNTAP